MLARILTYHQVMPAYLDFLSGFDPGAAVSDSKFSGFRERTSFSSSSEPLAIRDLGRSGYNFQLCYSLIAVASDSFSGGNLSSPQWALTQAAFHHQFDVREGTALWIITHTNGSIKEKLTSTSPTNQSYGFDRSTSATVEQSLANSLSTHLMLSEWSVEGWREYIKWLEETVQKQVRSTNLESYTSTSNFLLNNATEQRCHIHEAPS